MEIHCLKWGHTCARLKNVVKKATIFILMCYLNELGLNTVCHMLNEHFLHHQGTQNESRQMI